MRKDPSTFNELPDLVRLRTLSVRAEIRQPAFRGLARGKGLRVDTTAIIICNILSVDLIVVKLDLLALFEQAIAGYALDSLPPNAYAIVQMAASNHAMSVVPNFT